MHHRWPARVGMGVVLAAAAGLLVSAVGGLRARYPVVPSAAGRPGWVQGAFHVHTRRSDGRGAVEEVAAAARRAGLSFVVLTDHNITPGPPRFVDGVLVLEGVELSTPSGHLVALGASPPLEVARRSGADAVRAVRAAGGLAVLAHPVQRKNPWRDWEVGAQAGALELYSADSLFREALAAPLARLWPALGGWLGQRVHGVMTLVGDPVATRERLLSLPGPPVALCAHDAHGYPPYEDVFRALGVALPLDHLSPDPQEAAAQVLRALRAGEALCVFRALGDPAGFRLGGVEAGGRRARVGGALQVVVPGGAPAEVRVWGSGALAPDGRTVRLVRPGPVHVEVWVSAPGRWWGEEQKPWLVPSPIEVVP